MGNATMEVQVKTKFPEACKRDHVTTFGGADLKVVSSIPFLHNEQAIKAGVRLWCPEDLQLKKVAEEVAKDQVKEATAAAKKKANTEPV